MADHNIIVGGGAYTQDFYNQYENTLANSETRIPICFCIDTSLSMKCLVNTQDFENDPTRPPKVEDGQTVYFVRPKRPDVVEITRLDELKKVLKKMLIKMRNNDLISHSAVISIINFDRFADCFLEFSDLERIDIDSTQRINYGRDMTNTARGLKKSLDRIDQQVRMNSNVGNDSYTPVLIFMSDGKATDGNESLDMRDEVRERCERGNLRVIPIGIGNNFDQDWLRGLSDEGTVFTMRTESEFEDVFDLITRRLQQTASVISGDELDTLGRDTSTDDQPVDDPINSLSYGRDESASGSDFLSDFMNS